MTGPFPTVAPVRRGLRAAAAGVVLVGVLLGGLLTGCSAVGLPGSDAPSASSAAPSPAAASAAPLQVPSVGPLPSSPPTRLRIPSIDVDDSDLIPLGLQADRTIEVPPVSDPEEAGWFKFGATPGSVGPAVLLGHVDGGGQEGVFYDLNKMKPGEQVTVTREDGKNAVFTVTAIRSFEKTEFPTQLVYGKTPDSQLRLITCGGVLDRSAHNYLSNIIVFATLTGVTDA